MQGFNMGRYVPPELEGTLSANQVAGKHALGSRARKAGQGILTVRFEMPFAVWCTTCPKPTIIGQGVRFNAEKKRAGNYHSTPIWAFRMKHAECGGWIEVRTDPANTDYVVTEGGRRRDTGEERRREGDLEFRTDEERQRLRDDAFAALEVTIEDRKTATADKDRIEELREANDRDWSDPFALNKRLRKTFRIERKELERKAAATESLKDKMSLGIDLLDETEDDRRRAAVASFGEGASTDDQATITRARNRHLFSEQIHSSGSTTTGPNSSKSMKPKDVARASLKADLRSNTRARLDVFGDSEVVANSNKLSGIKRKHTQAEEPTKRLLQEIEPERSTVALVGYDSD